MRPYLKDILLVALMIGTGFLARSQWMALEERTDRLSKTQIEFAQRAQEAINTPEQSGYLGRIQSFLQVYKQDVIKSHGGRVEWSDEMQNKVVRQLENGVIDETQYEQKTQVLSLVKSAYATLLDARWRSQLTHLGKGDTRLDIYRIQHRNDSAGQAVLEADFFLWGIEPETQITWGQRATRYWQEPASAGQPDTPLPQDQAPPKSASEAQVVMTRNEGSARPAVFVHAPTRVVSRFPSYVAIGTLRLPPIPESATLMDIELAYTVRKSETDHETRLNWNRVPIATAWRSSDEAPAIEEENTTAE